MNFNDDIRAEYDSILELAKALRQTALEESERETDTECIWFNKGVIETVNLLLLDEYDKGEGLNEILKQAKKEIDIILNGG